MLRGLKADSIGLKGEARLFKAESFPLKAEDRPLQPKAFGIREEDRRLNGKEPRLKAEENRACVLIIAFNTFEMFVRRSPWTWLFGPTPSKRVVPLSTPPANV